MRARRRARSDRGGARAGRTPESSSRGFAGAERPGLAVCDDGQLEHVLARRRAARPWRSPTTRPASSTSASEQPTCSPRIARAAQARRVPRARHAREPLVHLERAFEACELLVRELRRDRLRQRDERHLVRDGDERKAQLLGLVGERRRRLGPARSRRRRRARRRPCPARRRTYSRCGRESSPTPSLVVISSSPPSSHGVGSGSSETWTQRIGLSASVRARSELQPEARQVSRCLGRSASCSAAPLDDRAKTLLLARGRKQAFTPSFMHRTNASLRHVMSKRSARGGRPCVHCARGGGAERIAACLSRAHVGRRRPRGARSATSREASRLPTARGRAAGGRAGRGGRRHRLPRLRGRDRLPEHGSRVRAGRRRDPRAGRPVTCTSASWSASTSPTSRSAAGSPSSRRARATSRSRSSSTRAPRRSRTRSRSRAPRPAGPASSSSTTASTAARC